MYPYSEKSAIIHLPLQNKRLSTMPNWIEAVIAYLKNQVSLRFTMVWLLYLVSLWLFLPESFFDFLNAKPIFGSVNNINAVLFIIPVSFFLSDITKRIYLLTFGIINSVKLKSIKRNNQHKISFVISSLSEDEKDYLAMFIDTGKEFLGGKRNDPVINSLLDKDILHDSSKHLSMRHTNEFIINPDYYSECVRQFTGYFNK